MANPLDDLVRRWKEDPSAPRTVTLCEAIRGKAFGAIAKEVGDLAAQRYATDVGLMLSVARMYIGTERLSDAQAVLVGAGKVAPREPDVYRWLGEVLLRRGDAERAEKVLERAIQLGTREPDARLWLERAKVFRPMQAKAGTRAVAAEVAHAAQKQEAARPAMDSYSDTTTMVRPIPPQVQPRAGTEDNGLRRPAAGLRPSAASSASLASVPIPRAQPPALPQAYPIDEENDLATVVGPRPTNALLAAATGDDPLEETTQEAPARRPHPMDADTAPAFAPLKIDSYPAAAQLSDLNDVSVSVTAPLPAPPLRPATPKPPPIPVEEPAPRAAPPVASHGAAAMAKAPQNPFAAAAMPKAAQNPYAELERTIAEEKALARPADEAAPPPIPHARDVLDALQIAGVFEPPDVARVAARWDRPTRGPRRVFTPLVLSLCTLLVVGGGIGVFFYVQTKRAAEQKLAREMVEQVDASLRAGQVGAVEEIENKLSTIFQLESRSTGAALETLRERALYAYVKKAAVSFEEPLRRAEEVGVPPEQVEFARLASSFLSGDTGGAVTLIGSQKPPKKEDDPWYQLFAGLTLERVGDPRAHEHYESAQKLGGDFVLADVALARATAIDGDLGKAETLTKAFRAKYPDRVEGAALLALIWAKGGGATPLDPAISAELTKGDAEIPSALSFVVPATAAVTAARAHDEAETQSSLELALSGADTPGIATWLGEVAMVTHNDALARKAALKALSYSTVYAPARHLAARVALRAGRLDEALKATEDLEATAPDVAVVRAAVAYERADAQSLERALESLSAEAKNLPLLASLTQAPSYLSPKSSRPGATLLDLSDDDPPWSDLLAMDGALDEGDLDTAVKIATAWAGKETPLRILRLARLARYQGKLDDADTMIQGVLGKGIVTVRSVMERVFQLVAAKKTAEVAKLLERYQPSVPPLLASWLGTYASAAGGKAESARANSVSLAVPPERAPFPFRIATAAAYGAMGDKKQGVAYVQQLLQAGLAPPEVVQAAIALGFKKTEGAGGKASYEPPTVP